MLTPAEVIYAPDKAIHGNKKGSTHNSTSPSYRQRLDSILKNGVSSLEQLDDGQAKSMFVVENASSRE